MRAVWMRLIWLRIETSVGRLRTFKLHKIMVNSSATVLLLTSQEDSVLWSYLRDIATHKRAYTCEMKWERTEAHLVAATRERGSGTSTQPVRRARTRWSPCLYDDYMTRATICLSHAEEHSHFMRNLKPSLTSASSPSRGPQFKPWGLQSWKAMSGCLLLTSELSSIWDESILETSDNGLLCVNLCMHLKSQLSVFQVKTGQHLKYYEPKS
jgi:hypothetical protein